MKKMITDVQSVDPDGQVKRKGSGHAHIFLGGVNTMDFMGGLRVNREGSNRAGKLGVRVEGESAARDGWSSVGIWEVIGRPHAIETFCN